MQAFGSQPTPKPKSRRKPPSEMAPQSVYSNRIHSNSSDHSIGSSSMSFGGSPVTSTHNRSNGSPNMTNPGSLSHRETPPRVRQYQKPLPIPKQQQTSPEAQLRDLFNSVDRNGSGALSEAELANALVNVDHTKFRPSTVRLMLNLFDESNSGTISFSEFVHLWNYIGYWRNVFKKFDSDGSLSISFSEYQTALETIGYRLPTDTVLFVFQRFSGPNSLQLKFDMFVESLIWLLRITDCFKKYDVQGNGVAVIQFQDFIHELMELR